jgi:hypothetical protein
MGCLHKKYHFNIQPSAMFVSWVVTNMVLLNAVHPLKIYQHITFCGPMLSDLPQKFE